MDHRGQGDPGVGHASGDDELRPPLERTDHRRRTEVSIRTGHPVLDLTEVPAVVHVLQLDALLLPARQIVEDVITRDHTDAR